MGKIIHINLNDEKIIERKNKSNDYGRALINQLILADSMVLCPGFLSGTTAPSTGRLIMGSKINNNDVLFSNIGGTISQKLASLNIDALIISGENLNDAPATILIEKDNVKLEYMEELQQLEVTPTLEKLYDQYGDDCGVIGIGPSGENMLPVSTLFTTYPKGNPAYYCVRASFGDVFGFKKIKALIVRCQSYFDSNVYDPESFRKTSKELSRLIIEHPLCGNALPNMGSSFIMKLLNEESINLDNITIKERENFKDGINRTCSPLCVVGCLNRHVESEDDIYNAPFHSEVIDALENSFGIYDKKFAKKFTMKCFELGIDCMEFIFTCQMYFDLMNVKVDTCLLDNAIHSLKNMTLEGRVLGSTTKGIHSLFADKRKAESMVTRPSITEEYKFNINIPSRTSEAKEFSDLEYLYSYIILLENLGFCLFTSFTFLDSKDALGLLEKLYYYKTGEKTDGMSLLKYSYNIIKDEKKIPNFIKVLYRYFNT